MTLSSDDIAVARERAGQLLNMLQAMRDNNPDLYSAQLDQAMIKAKECDLWLSALEAHLIAYREMVGGSEDEVS